MEQKKDDNIRKELELYKDIVNSLPQSMFLMDKDKKFIGIYNATPETLAGVPVEEIIGSNVLQYVNDPSSPFHEVCTMLNTAFDSVIRTGQPLSFAFNILDSKLEAFIVKLPDERILSQVRNITPIIHRQQEIEQKKREELKMVLEAGGVTSWSYDAKTKTFSSQLENNVIGQEEMPLDVLLSLLEPEYRQEILDMFDQILNHQSKHLSATVRVRNRDGNLQWSNVHAIPQEYDADGNVTHIIGSQKDITTDYEYNEKLQELVKQKEQMLQELEDAKKKAEQSDALKSAFLANMSHEIRTPLNAIVGFSQMIAEAENEEERDSYLSIINGNSDLLLTLINDILDLSKIEAGYAEYVNTRFDLASLTEELEMTISSKLKPGVQLINHKPFEHCYVYLDASRVKQLYINFLTNACKFTTQGSIEIGYFVMNGGVKLYVKDSGCGISEEKQAKVFERFEKLDNFTQGTGLGMSICKAIAEAYNGEIGLSSKVGEGSLFWVWLPTEVETGKAVKVQTIQDSIKALIEEKEQTEGIQKEPGHSSTIRILMAEDIDSNYFLLKAMLKGYDLVRVNNGVEAIEKALHEKFDLILMDICMPLMDGLKATRIIREFNPKIPIIAITAYTSESDRLKAMGAGCNGFLGKPVNRKKLLEIMIWGK